MKVHLTVGSELCLGGYLNLDPFPFEGKTQHDITDLNQLLDPGEVTDLVIPDALDLFTLEDKGRILSHWTSFLAHGGSIMIGGIDLCETARKIYCGDIDVPTANSLLYTNGPLLPSRRSILNIDDIVDILTQMGLNVVSKKLHNCHYYVGAVRP